MCNLVEHILVCLQITVSIFINCPSFIQERCLICKKLTWNFWGVSIAIWWNFDVGKHLNGRSPDIVVVLQVLFCPTNFLCRGEFGGWEGRSISSVEGMTGLPMGCPVGSGRFPGGQRWFLPRALRFFLHQIRLGYRHSLNGLSSVHSVGVVVHTPVYPLICTYFMHA